MKLLLSILFALSTFIGVHAMAQMGGELDCTNNITYQNSMNELFAVIENADQRNSIEKEYIQVLALTISGINNAPFMSCDKAAVYFNTTLRIVKDLETINSIR